MANARAAARAGPSSEASTSSDASTPPRWLGFASGAVAGATGVLVGHGFDTMKVEAQLGGAASAARPASEPLLARTLALYRGILPPLLTTGGLRSIYFAIFENTKLQLGVSPGAEAPMRTTVAAAAITGVCTAPVTQPFVALKVWQQANGGSLGEAAAGLTRSGGGVRGFFPGFWLHCALELMGSTVYLGVYHFAKRALRRDDGAEPVGVRVLAGAAAGCTAWSSIYPVDVLRSRIMSSGGRRAVSDVAREVYASGGLRAFYRGISATLMRAGPVAGVLLPVNDQIYEALSRRYGAAV